MKAGDKVHTPRFLMVTIEEVLTPEEAREKGYTEPTHYRDDPDYDIFGKPIDGYHVKFAAVRKVKWVAHE